MVIFVGNGIGSVNSNSEWQFLTKSSYKRYDLKPMQFSIRLWHNGHDLFGLPTPRKMH